MSIGSIIMIIFYIALIVLLIFPKSKIYLREHKELATAILYTFLTVWFSRILLTRSTIQTILSKMKTNGLYIFLLVFYIGVPIFFLYKSIQYYQMYFAKEKELKIEQEELSKKIEKSKKVNNKKGKKK